MTSLKNFILENIEILPNKDGKYRTIILCKRDNVDCEHISKEEFCKLINEDYQIAIKESSKLLDKEYEDSKEERIERVRKEAERYVASHYKQKARAQRYIDNAVANETSKERNHWEDVDRFDFDINFGKSQGVRIIENNSSRKSTIESIYDDLTQDKYKYSIFKEATGWEFIYICDNKSFISRFRPEIELLLSDSKKEEIEQNRKKLGEEIERFYANTKYWGD